MNQGAFRDQVVLVTGAGTGAGRRLVHAFAERGAIVAANDISPVNVEPLVKEIIAGGGQAHVYLEDLAKKVAVQALVNRIEDALGHIDILVHHAAVSPEAGLLELDEWDWHRTLDVNLTAAFLLVQSVGRLMRGRGGVILNVTSLEPGAHGAPYAVCVGAIEALTRAAASELAPHGIRVHMLARRLPHSDGNTTGVPTTLAEAATHLCTHPELNGLVVNVEDA